VGGSRRPRQALSGFAMLKVDQQPSEAEEPAGGGTPGSSVAGHSDRENAMRQDAEIRILEEGISLQGWLYTPEDGAAPFPAVIMAHGFSAVKEMYLDAFAEVFAQAGLAVLVFDNRNFGASDGTPRQEIDPWVQVRDYRHAITYAGTRPEVDRERIGVWGSSYSGGHALVVAAIDRRVRCVVSQVPLVSGYRNILRLVRADMLAQVRAQFDQDREARFAGQPPAMIPVVSADPAGPAALPTADSYEWFTETGRTRAPAWKNEVTVRTVELLMDYEPAAYLERISPTPLLMVVAARDHLTPADLALAAYERALEPKRLALLPGGHFEAYVGPGFELASGAARDWFVQHLP
jgi:fermentation-respiration switch protein FrsA (DUF1100 family)